MPPETAFPWTETQATEYLRKAVQHYWRGRAGQSKRQGGRRGQAVGARKEVTGG